MSESETLAAEAGTMLTREALADSLDFSVVVSTDAARRALSDAKGDRVVALDLLSKAFYGRLG